MTSITIQNLTVNVGEGINPIPFFLGELQLPRSAENAAHAPRFIPSEDGTTVTDTKTGLVWSQGNVGGRVNFADAEKAVAACRLGGHDDWRLPTRRELEAIIDLDRHDPAIDPAFACESSWYWTSTPYAASSSVYAWIVDFHDGLVSSYRRGNDAFVRAVRGASPAGQ